MVAIAKGETVDTTNPKLVFVATDREGKLTDLTSLSFEVFDKTSDPKKTNPVSVIASAAVNLADPPTGTRLGLGRYTIDQLFATTLASGLYEIRWTYQFPTGNPGGHSGVARVEFDVLDGTGAFLGPAYALVSEMRDEGISPTTSDARVQLAIVTASAFIEKITGRFFEPRYSDSKRFSTRATRAVLMSEPIVGIEEIRFETEPSLVPDLEVDRDNYRVFNRHLSAGLLGPDDRESPKVEFVHSEDSLGMSARFAPLSGVSLRSLGFPIGVQNVLVKGVFGYTDGGSGTPSDIPWGRVPPLINHATKLLANRNIPKIADTDCRSDARDQWRIIEQKVLDQSVRLSPERNWGKFTGDPEIDQILVMYMRPPELGAA